MQNGHYDKAVKMTVAAGKHTQALEMAVQHEGALSCSSGILQAWDSIVQAHCLKVAPAG